MQETRSEWQGGSGAHTETLLCSYRFNVFVLQKFFFLFYSSGELNRSVLFYQNIHVLNVCGYTPNDFVVQKHEYIQPSTPFIQYPHPQPPYKKEKRKRKVKAFNKIERHTIFLHNITARTAVQLSIHSKRSLPK